MIVRLVRQRAFIDLAAQMAPGRARRKDLEGIPALIDMDTTMRMAKLSQPIINGVSLALQSQLHLTLVTGSVVAGDRLKAMGCVPTDTCALDGVRHDVDHLFWECSAMRQLRKPFLSQLLNLTT